MPAHPASPSLRVRLLAVQPAPTDDPRRLALIRFGDANHAEPVSPRELRVALPQLTRPEYMESWIAPNPVESGFERGIGYARSDELLFGWMLIDESSFDHELERAAEHAYDRLLAFHVAAGYPHLLRIWNYFPDIHRETEGLDRYQAFCLGRHRALSRVAIAEGELPAATAIGTGAPGLLIYFLAGRESGEQIENPRQVSAFQYPRRYGPKSPSFSRATLRRDVHATQLYISGTASIVGHETVHTNAVTQVDEILNNLEALIQRASASTPLTIAGPAELSLLKVYVRRPGDLQAVRARLEARLGTGTPAVYLRGDICRRDLLVEIEGLYA